jgi:cell division GTPase FtsZ
MKPADRSLDIAVLGLGQAGGNIAAEFHRRGYRALAFNSARSDLASLALPEAQRIYIGLESGAGAGSDVEGGRECLTAHAEEIRAALAEHAASADVVVVAAGLGNGIGSCAPEFVALVREQGLPVVAMTALPHHHESGIVKVNALCAIRDIAENPPFGWVLVDNAKLARLHHDLPIDAYFQAINRDIVEPIDVFNRLNDRESAAPIRMLGAEDLRTLLLGGGILNYHARELSKLTAVDVFEAVRGGMADNPIMPSGADLASVAYLGLVIEASERTLANVPFSFYEEIAEQAKRETGGAAVYLGLYRVQGAEDGSATVRILACAHALPTGVSDLTAEAEREAGAIQQKAAQHVAALDLGGLERLRPMRVPSGARGTRRAEPPPRELRQSEPVAESEAPAANAIESTPTESENEPARNDAPRDPSGQPSRGRYERLANAFRAASADSARARIAGELVAGQQSQDSLERFYAVNAMARVDATYFRDALRNAARDTDRHVSDLARRALEKLART